MYVRVCVRVRAPVLWQQQRWLKVTALFQCHPADEMLCLCVSWHSHPVHISHMHNDRPVSVCCHLLSFWLSFFLFPPLFVPFIPVQTSFNSFLLFPRVPPLLYSLLWLSHSAPFQPSITHSPEKKTLAWLLARRFSCNAMFFPILVQHGWCLPLWTINWTWSIFKHNLVTLVGYFVYKCTQLTYFFFFPYFSCLILVCNFILISHNAVL